jgi:hypothetical protein
MKRIRLINWNEEEGRERVSTLEKGGYRIEYEIPSGPGFLKNLRQNPPDVMVIDLSRIPSQGRDLGLAIRRWKATRHIPLVFVGGDHTKVSKIEELLPDAEFTSWDKVHPILEKALTNPPLEPVVPNSVMAGYSGTPLPKKLGIKPRMTVGTIHPPDDFRDTLGTLPGKVILRKTARGRCDLLIWFVDSKKELLKRLPSLAERSDYRSLWIAWPKQSSGVQTDLTQQTVRTSGLSHGLVDYKICAIDATWSGLLFTHRKPDRVS